MVKKKVTSNGEKNQEAVDKQLIKHFSSGVVSWSIFYDYWHKQDSLFLKLNFFIMAIFNDDSNWHVGLDTLEDIIAEAKEKHEEIWEKAKAEKKEAGENDVSTIKDTSKRKFMAEELAKHLSGHVEKAEKELQEIDA
jgi:hypothetical protein